MISDVDFPQVKEVDLKLIELARSLLGQIVTNDFNLNKVAQLRGVEVLNINELANVAEARRAAGRSDERVHPQGRQGIQPGRGLSRRRHDGGRRQRAQRIGKNVDIVVTSVLQTTAGRMIFGTSRRSRARRRPRRAAEAAPIAPTGTSRRAGRARPHRRERCRRFTGGGRSSS